MKNLMMIWLSGAATSALAIAFDIRRLKVNKVGLSLPGWAFVCVCASAFALLPYVILRRRVWRELIDAVWTLVGDSSDAIEMRRKRLEALRGSGLVGDAAFRACVRKLEAQNRSTGH